MLLREDLEQREIRELKDAACKSLYSKGRVRKEEKCEYRTDFQRDRDRIIHSKAFRRLMHKTQVFLSPEGDHFRTRLTHTLEVAQVARTIARSMNVNEDLSEAIALGHDLGHTPFGHNGEMVLNEIHPGGFRHNEQSLRVVDKLENSNDEQGMNLTYEVRDGILNHSGKNMPSTIEGQIVRISDRIAYINHDIDDALRSGVILFEDLPKEPIATFGNSHSQRINSMIKNLIENSDENAIVQMSEDYRLQMDNLRKYMFENVYNSSKVKKEEDLTKIEVVISALYQYFIENPNKLPIDNQSLIMTDGINVVVKDYIAGMTDRYALNTYVDLFVPKNWK